MKNLKKVLALVLAVVMIMGSIAVASAKTYTDADNDTYKAYADAIDVLSELKILDGFKDGDKYSFKADQTFTRAQAAKIVAIVHNATIKGSIQADIADLYANAQNPFVDCNGNWALPYINYCRITGLADGMTATTYEPKREVTGVQFLKLMLTTLGFDTSKEGYTGTGWDINVLRRANEIGLLDGMEKGFEAIKPLKRGEAAQILYNALAAYMVEYGQVIKPGKTLDIAFISNENVSQSGFSLFEKMGGKVVRDTDEFRRPGYTWSTKSGWSKFYMDKPVNSYTSSVSECDILKNDMGIAENKSTVVTLDGGNKGAKKADETLNYYAVDGYKWNKIELGHDNTMNCKKTVYGCQGTLTQVFETEDGYVITSIHTFLADVLTVKAVDRKTHGTGNVTTLQAYINVANDSPADHYSPAVMSQVLTIATADYAVGTKLNVTISYKAQQDKNADPTLVSYAVAETKVGKLTGASDMHYPETTSIDGTQYNDNCTFTYGKDDAMNYANRGSSFTFYFDSYGNVIGCGPVAAEAANYTVLDRIYGEHVKGEFVLKGDLFVNGEVAKDVTISSAAGSFKFAQDGWNKLAWDYDDKPIEIFTDAAKNDVAYPFLTDALYTYTVADDVYTLTWVGLWPTANGCGRIDVEDEAPRFEGPIQHIAKRASLSVFPVDDNGYLYPVNLSESTKFICKGVDGTWKTYTGYTELPALTARYLDYVTESDDSSFATVVYLGGVVYAADKIVGYVPTWEAFNWSGDYDVITVYVKGEAVKVNLKHGDQYDGEHFGDVLRDPGMYEFEMAVDANGVTYAEVKIPVKTVKAYEGVVDKCVDKTAIIVNEDGDLTPAIGLTGVAIYAVDGDVVTAVDKDYIMVGDYVVVYSENGEITEIYIIG